MNFDSKDRLCPLGNKMCDTLSGSVAMDPIHGWKVCRMCMMRIRPSSAKCVIAGDSHCHDEQWMSPECFVQCAKKQAAVDGNE